MARNNAKKGVVELWGRKFNIAKEGLDEAQVAPFVNDLISERDMLVQRVERCSSLTKLAEKTVAEADKLAEELKEEARDQAKAEASKIIAQAEEQAQQIIEQKRTDANAQAAVIKAEVERKATLLLENERKRIQPELSNFVDRLYRQILSELEGFKQQLLALQELKFEHRLFQPAEETSAITVEADEIPNEFQELIRPIDQTNTGEPEWELEILPPMDIIKIMQIVTYLDGLPEVENTELIPEMDKPSILVFVREPIHLVDVLRTLPGVAQVKEDTNGEMAAITGTTHTEGERRKIQIKLSEDSILVETKKD